MKYDKTWTGKNPDFVVKWSCEEQRYDVFKSGKLIRTVYSFREAQNYLN